MVLELARLRGLEDFQVVVMEKQHRSKVLRRFRSELSSKRLVCLDIPDSFEFMQPELIALL